MKKILCMFMAFVLCISTFTCAAAEEDKKEPVSTTVSFGTFSLELPDGWEVGSFESAAKNRDADLFDNPLYRLSLESLDDASTIHILFTDAYNLAYEQIDDNVESLIERFILKNYVSRDTIDGLLNEQYFFSILLEQAKQFGKSREDIVEHKFGEYDFIGFSCTGQEALDHIGGETTGNQDAIVYMYMGALKGYIIGVVLNDYTKDHFGVLQELLGVLRISDADTSEPIAAYGPVSFDANKEWVETFRLTGENHLQAELTSIYDTDVSFLLTIYDVWPNILEEISASGRELDENSRGDFDSLEMATEYLLLLTQTSNIDADDIENCQLGEYDFCRTIMPECKALDGSKACNVPIYSAFIDSYWIYFYLFPSDDSDLYGAFIDTLDSISINASDAVL